MMIIVIIAGTYAWFSYRSNKTAMVLTIGEINNVQVTLSPYQIKANISSQTTYNSENYTSVTAINNSNSYKIIRLYYKIDSIDNELISSNFKYTIERSTNSTTYSQYKTGNFSTASNGGELTILGESIPSGTTYNYKVYIWLDGTNSGQNNIIGKTFNGELRAEIVENQYQFVEYLETTGTQYILTNVYPTTNFKLVADIYVPSQYSGELTFAGGGSAGNNAVEYYIYNGHPRFWSRENGSASALYINANSAYDQIIHYEATNTPTGRKIETNVFESKTDSFIYSGGEALPLTIFAYNYGSSRNYFFKGRLYSMKMYNNDILINDFIPCYRKTDGVRGLFDSVNGMFYTNAGSGTFGIGPEI